MGDAIAGIEDGKRIGPRRRARGSAAPAIRATSRRARRCSASLPAAIAGGANPEQILAPPLSDEERALADGWVTRARDPRALAAGELEARLAAVPPRHPLGSDAMRLRVQGRLASGDPALVKDANRARRRAIRPSLRPELDPAARGDRGGRGRIPPPCSRCSPSCSTHSTRDGPRVARSPTARAISPARRPPTIRSCPGSAPRCCGVSGLRCRASGGLTSPARRRSRSPGAESQARLVGRATRPGQPIFAARRSSRVPERASDVSMSTAARKRRKPGRPEGGPAGSNSKIS